MFNNLRLALVMTWKLYTNVAKDWNQKSEGCGGSDHGFWNYKKKMVVAFMHLPPPLFPPYTYTHTHNGLMAKVC